MNTSPESSPSARSVVVGGTLVTGAVAGIFALAALLIGPWEGTKLKPYYDIVGKLTWCTGETRGTPKAEYTPEECDALLRESIAGFYRDTSKCIHKPLEEHQWAAILSWSYNVGSSAACGSTLVRQINAGKPPEVWCQQLLRWNKAGGREVRGLTNRRKAELKVCLGDLSGVK